MMRILINLLTSASPDYKTINNKQSWSKDDGVSKLNTPATRFIQSILQ